MFKEVEALKFKNKDLKEAEILGLLSLLNQNHQRTLKELVAITGLPSETLKTFLGSVTSSMYKLGKPFQWESHSYKGKVEVETFLVQLRTKYSLLPKREYDQFFATPETSYMKAQIMFEQGNVTNKRILVLGDDDLVSVMLKKYFPDYAQLTVLDIDPDILKCVSETANAQVIKHDVLKPLPTNLLGSFDVIVTDPPYTTNGVKLFTQRSLEALGETKDMSGKYIYMYYGNSFKNPAKFLKVQEVFSNAHLLIESRIDKFARYKGAESIGSSSSLYVLKTNSSTKPLKQNFSPLIYTHTQENEEQFPYVDHLVFKLTRVSAELLKSKSKLLQLFGHFINIHGLKVVDTNVTQFKGGAFSISYTLATSNLCVHTWPEFGAVHVDLIICEPIKDKSNIAFTLGNLFKTNTISVLQVE